MIESYISTWKRPFDFRGRSTRKEYWEFVFLNLIISFLSYIILTFFITFSKESDSSLLSTITAIPLYIISVVGMLFVFGSVWVALPLTVRRIRDIGMSWKWIFFVSIPYLGAIFVLIFLTRTSIVSIDGKEYYLRQPTKKSHIQAYWISLYLIPGLVFLGIFLVGIILSITGG